MSIPNSLSLPLNLSLDLILYMCYKIISVLKYFVILPRSLKRKKETKIFDHDPFAFLHHVKLFTECDPYTSIPYSTPEKL